MKLEKIRGGDMESLNNKQYNIGVGISIGNKWFTIENILDYVEWSLKNTKEYVVIYIADSIHAINIEARERKSPESAKRKAKRLGNELMERIMEAVDKKFTEGERRRIHYARWQDLYTDSYKEKVKFLLNKYHKDEDFSNKIIRLLESMLVNEAREFSPKDKKKLGSYLVEEMPELLFRTPIRGLDFEAYVYPHDGEVLRFIEDIQKGLIFPEISEIKDTDNKVALVLN